MKHLFYSPHRALQKFIKGYAFLFSDNLPDKKVIPVPDGTTVEIGIIPPTGNSGLKVKYYHEEKEREFKSFFGNVTNLTEYICSDGNQLRYIGVIAYPYSTRFLFKQDPIDLVTCPDLSYYLRTNFDNLLEKLEYASTPVHCCTILNEFFMQYIGKAKKIDDRLNIMFSDPLFFKKNSDTRQLANTLCITPRSLQRFFKDTMGVTPKKFLNLIRASAVITDIKQGTFSNCSDITFSYKYSDQSHFNAEFKAATNLPPGFFIKNRHRLFLNYARHLILLDKVDQII
jgi:AraC-like DNA-binding protein